MIVIGFSTVGKTTLVKKSNGKAFDFEVGKLTKMMGLKTPDWDRLGALAERISTSGYLVLCTRIEILNSIKRERPIIVVPNYGFKEFKRRLSERYNGDLSSSDEWRFIGMNYAMFVHSWCRTAKERDLPLLKVFHLAEHPRFCQYQIGR